MEGARDLGVDWAYRPHWALVLCKLGGAVPVLEGPLGGGVQCGDECRGQFRLSGRCL